jgi:hypothetical protein
MNEKRWEQAGAAAGIATVVLFVVGTFVIPQVPRIDSPTAKFVTWITSHRRGAEVSTVLAMFGAGTLVWFVSHLRHVLQRAENGAEAFAPIVYGSGLALAAVSAIGTVPIAVLALMAGQKGGITTADASVVRLLIDLNQVLLAPFVLLSAVFLLSFGAAMLRHELLASWLGIVAMIAAVLNGISVVTTMVAGTYNQAALVIGFGGYLGFALVLLVASTEMLWIPETDRAAERGPVFQPSPTAA